MVGCMIGYRVDESSVGQSQSGLSGGVIRLSKCIIRVQLIYYGTSMISTYTK